MSLCVTFGREERTHTRPKLETNWSGFDKSANFHMIQPVVILDTFARRMSCRHTEVWNVRT